MSVIAITIEGGLIQSIGLLDGEPVDVLVIDYDTELDPSDGDTVLVPQSDEPDDNEIAYATVTGSEQWPDNATTRWAKSEMGVTE